MSSPYISSEHERTRKQSHYLDDRNLFDLSLNVSRACQHYLPVAGLIIVCQRQSFSYLSYSSSTQGARSRVELDHHLVQFYPMESPRLWGMENRLKLLSNVTLIYVFSLHLLGLCYLMFIQSILRFECHRTGNIYRKAVIPLYRLRWAISRLWNDYW